MKLKEEMVLNIVKMYPVERQSTLLMPRILVRVIRIHAYRIRTIVKHKVNKVMVDRKPAIETRVFVPQLQRSATSSTTQSLYQLCIPSSTSTQLPATTLV